MAKVLVTGGTGFIGSQIVLDLLRKGFPVKALKRKASRVPVYLQDKPVEWAEGDMTDIVSLQEAVQGTENIIHCAAFVSLSNIRRRHMYKVNIEGTANLVNAALDAGIKKLVHVSSVAGLGRVKDREFITEATKFDYDLPNSAYGISKYESECEVWRGMAEGLKVVVVNPTIVLAHKDWARGSGRMFGQVRKGLRFYPRGGNGYVDVRDVSDCVIRLMESDISGERFLINAENIPFREFFGMIAEEMGKAKPGIRLQPWMLEVAWRVNWLYSKITGAEPLITKDSARAGCRHTLYSNAKIRQALGIDFIPIRQTIRDMIREHQQSAEHGTWRPAHAAAGGSE